jgi:nicotinamide riboside transporter PnuC
MALVPVYINELSPKQLIGSFGVFTQLFVIIGVVFSYLFGLILNKAGVA